MSGNAAMGEKSMQAKVGALILVSLGLLTAFVLVLGKVNTTEGFNLNVLYVHPGALQPGAPVKIAGGEVGYVDEMTYLGTKGPFAPRPEHAPPDQPPQRTRVKVKIWVEERVRTTIMQDADYYVTQQGLLGEAFMEIGPGGQGPHIQPETSVFGTDPPRLDRALANGANSLETINRMLVRNEVEIDQLISSASRALETIDQLMSRNEDEIDDVVAHADELSAEASAAASGARKMYVDNRRLDRTLRNLDSTLTLVADREDELLDDLDRTVDATNELRAVIGPDQRTQIRSARADLEEITDDANSARTDVEVVVARVRRGEGTVGAFLMDEEAWDDLKELLRDIKHNPWKFFWRE